MSILGIIGGSGLSDFFLAGGIRKLRIKTPYGVPSSDILEITKNGYKTYFLPRHGVDHLISPSHINYRANIFALKKLGVTDLVSISAVGSLDDNLSPGAFVLCDQFVDLTKNRKSTFFDEDFVVHVSMANPICKRLAKKVENISKNINSMTTFGATYVAIEGPQFSTKSESQTFRSLGYNVIGMTNMPEAKLAREAGICYATLAMVTDFDSWHPLHDHVNIEMIVNTMTNNLEKVKKIITKLIYDNQSNPSERCKCCGDIKSASLSNFSKVSNASKLKYDLFMK